MKKGLLLFSLCLSIFTYSQTSLTYTIQTGNANSTPTSAGSGCFTGAYNNSITEIGLYANGSCGSVPQVAFFQTFTTTANGNTGSARPLQVGDEFTITGYIGNNTSIWASGGAVGISFNDNASYSGISNYNTNQRAKFEIVNGGNWYSSPSTATYPSVGSDATFKIKVTSSNTVNLTLNGTTYYDIVMLNSPSSSSRIQSFTIYNFGSGASNDTYWKNGNLSASTTVEIGNGNGSSSISGIITDGLTANSNSTASVNSVTKAGSGTIALTEANTYTGTTSVTNGTLRLFHAGGGTLPSSNNVTVSSGGTLRISSDQTLNNLTVAVGGFVIVDPGATLTITGTCSNSGTITVTPGGALKNSSAISNVTLQQSISAQRGYRVFANPFSTGQTDLSGTGLKATTTTSNDVKTYDNSSDAWVSAGSGYSSESIAANQAYACFIRGAAADNVTGLSYTTGPSAFTYSVSGTLNGSSVNVPTATNASHFTLVGNPYAAPVNSQALAGGGVTPISYYVYQYNISQTSAQVKSGGWSPVLASDNASPIPVLGVIAVQTGGNYSVSTSDINTGSTSVANLFGVQPTLQYAELQVEQNGNYQDKFYVRLDANASVNGTDKIDLEKFYNDNVNVYTIATADNTRLAIDSRNVLSTIPLGISALAGDYNFKLINNNLPEGTTVTLTDKFLNTNTTLKVGDVYPFSITTDAASHGEQRFALSFSTKTTATTINSGGGLTANVLGNITSSNQVAVQIAGASAPVTIAVKDMNGKAISTINAVNGIQYLNVGDKAAGMLILQISDGKSSVVKKIMKL